MARFGGQDSQARIHPLTVQQIETAPKALFIYSFPSPSEAVPTKVAQRASADETYPSRHDGIQFAMAVSRFVVVKPQSIPEQ